MGTVIKIAGRIGTVTNIDLDGSHYVGWGNIGDGLKLELRKFPDLEIGIHEPTISEEAAREIINFSDEILDQGEITVSGGTKLEEKIISMIEKKN